MLHRVKVLVGVSGGIAAYKVVDLVSKLVRERAEVKVIMTKNACEFITPLTFSSLSKNPVYLNDFSKDGIIPHLALARWADIFVIAPATANIIGKCANGIGDDLLSTTFLAYNGPTIFVPSMNSKMYERSTTQKNLSILKSMGCTILEPDIGRLASGEVGIGRYPDNEVILNEIMRIVVYKSLLFGKRILVTAGPTREFIDPVRFITNRSSGKMGYEMAKAAYMMGGDVKLITGVTQLPISLKGIERRHVATAKEMLNAVREEIEGIDMLIMAAAVADYRPKEIKSQKIKKDEEQLILTLERTEDILKELKERKRDTQTFIGFAAETEEHIENARKKVVEKGLDYIVLNDVSKEDIGFESDENEVLLLDRRGEIIAHIPRKQKVQVAKEILEIVLERG